MQENRKSKMEEMKVEVISRERIKPSSSTPHHLKTFKLSRLDQLTPYFYTKILLFYPSSQSTLEENIVVQNTQRSDRLKKSLSETLTRFYPLAGTVKDNLIIHCDDHGADFLEAKVSCELSKVLEVDLEQDSIIMNELLPIHSKVGDDNEDEVQLAIQFNMFECGGSILGISILHKIIDASSLSTFIISWAKTCTTNNIENPNPSFDSSSIFPSMKQLVSMGLTPLQIVSQDEKKIITKRFVFNSSSINNLKSKVDRYIENPTRVEVVSALLWSCASRAKAKANQLTKFDSVVNVAVNLRGRMVPPLPKHSLGNILGGAVAKTTIEIDQEQGTEFCKLVGKLRDSIRKVDDDYVKRFKSEDGYLRSMEEIQELFINSRDKLYTITSWCGFPFYEADFGWGKPNWVRSLNMYATNVFMYFDTRFGDGIEAWVTLDEHEMCEFESDFELQEFVWTIDGSPERE